MAGERFSDRYGLRSESDLIYDDVPLSVRIGLREVLEIIEYRAPSAQRSILCKAFRISPDPSNWSEYPNVEQEVSDLIQRGEWYEFYDALERMPRLLRDQWAYETFIAEANRLLAEESAGYRFEDGRLERVGTLEFSEAVAGAHSALQAPEFAEPRRQFERALSLRSARPQDSANVIKEATNSVEGTLQVIYRRPGVSMSTIVSEQVKGVAPGGVVDLFRALYRQGSGTTGARHAGIGGADPTEARAELAVHVAAALHAYAVSELR
jgi:hypothetical protein